MANDSLNLGLIGAGRIGQMHAVNLSRQVPEAVLSMISDVDGDAARGCANQFGIPHCVSDWRELVAAPEIGAIVICSPTNTHAEIIGEAARAGKHVFCEKPIDFDLSRIDEALKAVAQAGVLLQVGFNRRFDANAQRMKQAVTRGEIGELSQLLLISRDPAPPPVSYIKKSGGIFLDMTIHDFDMARFLVGDEVREVFATGSVEIDSKIGAAGDYDTASIVLKFEKGAVGLIQNSRRAVYGYDQRMELFGSNGSVSAENRSSNTVTVRGSESINQDLPQHFFLDRYRESFIEEMNQFVRAVLTGSPSPVSGEEGIAPVKIGKAALKSCRENRPVKIDEID